MSSTPPTLSQLAYLSDEGVPPFVYGQESEKESGPAVRNFWISHCCCCLGSWSRAMRAKRQNKLSTGISGVGVFYVSIFLAFVDLIYLFGNTYLII